MALTECGNLPKISAQWRVGAKWLFFAPWYDYGRTSNPNSTEFKSTDHSNCNAEWWQDAFSTDYVLTRADFKRVLTGIQGTVNSQADELRFTNGCLRVKGKGVVQVYSLSGERVRQWGLNGEEQIISLHGLPIGAYVIRCGAKSIKIKV